MGTPPSAPPLSSKMVEGAGEGERYCRFQNQFVAQIESPLGRIFRTELCPRGALMFLCPHKLRKHERAMIFLRPAFIIPQGEPLTFNVSHSFD